MPEAMTTPHHVTIGNLTLGADLPLALIAGPFVMESRDHALGTAGTLVEMTTKLGLGLIYKTSYDKANRADPGSVALVVGLLADEPEPRDAVHFGTRPGGSQGVVVALHDDGSGAQALRQVCAALQSSDVDM